MNADVFRYGLVAALMGLGTGVSWGQVPEAPRGRNDVKAEVLTRGPVHEAFAGTVSFDPKPGMLAPKTPPEAIEEIPPDQKPEGTNVTWIPGYFAWDEDRTDYVWVSGTWRAVPPGRQWVPGYWRKAGRGAQWTSGYWADAEADEVEYLPAPPRSMEEGPNIDAPSESHVWIPGNWVWNHGRYAWRPGYWTVAHPNWDWIPAYYVWAPRGYVFVNGYYDYPCNRRGIVFAPVYGNWNNYGRRGYAYSPTVAINPLTLITHLFLRPSYGHYYYGDYYDSNYSNAGYSSWFTFHSSRGGYDPFYARERWNHREDRDWDHHMQESFERRRDNEQERPPRTWAEQQARGARGANSDENHFAITAALSELARSTNLPIRMQTVERGERQQNIQRAEAIQLFREERQKLESVATADSKSESTRESEPQKMKLPVSPVVGVSVEQLGKDKPPTRTEALRPVVTDEPQTRPQGDRKSPKGETKKGKGDPNSSTPDAKTPDGTPKSKKGETKAPKGSQKTPEGESKPSKDEPKSQKGEAKPSKDDPTPKGESKPPKDEPKAPKGESNPPKDEPTVPKGEPKPSKDDPTPKGEPKPPKDEPTPKGEPKPSKDDPTPKGEPKPPKDEPTPKGDSTPKGESKPPKDKPKPPKTGNESPLDEPRPLKSEPKLPMSEPKALKTADRAPKEASQVEPKFPRTEPSSPKDEGKPAKKETSRGNRSESAAARATDTPSSSTDRKQPNSQRSGKTPRAGQDPTNPRSPRQPDSSAKSQPRQVQPAVPQQPQRNVEPPPAPPAAKPVTAPPAEAPKVENPKDKDGGK